MADLQRFHEAQADSDTGFARALAELRSGRKRSHWIWYIFPQLAGLGQSRMAEHYGLQGVAEARDYLRDPVLRTRLLTITRVLAGHLSAQPCPSLKTLMGSMIDAQKTVSCLTLFRPVAERLHAEDPHADYAALAQLASAVLHAAAAQGFPACAFTAAQLATPKPPPTSES